MTASQEDIAGGRQEAAQDAARKRILDEFASGPSEITATEGERPPGPRIGGPRIWTDERIRGQLGAFCAGRKVWPSAADFRLSGLGDLYQALYRYGGVEYWAATLGLSRSRPSLAVRAAARTRGWWLRRPRSVGRLPLLLAVVVLGLATAGGIAAWLAVPPDDRSHSDPGILVAGGAGVDESHRGAAGQLAAQEPSAGMRASRNHAVVVDLVGVGSDARVVVRNNTSRGRLLFAGVLRKTASLQLEGRRFWVRLGEPRAVRLRVDGRRAFLSRRARIFVVTEDGVRVLPPPTPDVPQPAPPAASVSDTAVPIADSTQMPTESPSPPPSSPPSSSGPPASSGSSSDGGTPSPDPPGVDPTPDPEPR